MDFKKNIFTFLLSILFLNSILNVQLIKCIDESTFTEIPTGDPLKNFQKKELGQIASGGFEIDYDCSTILSMPTTKPNPDPIVFIILQKDDSPLLKEQGLLVNLAKNFMLGINLISEELISPAKAISSEIEKSSSSSSSVQLIKKEQSLHRQEPNILTLKYKPQSKRTFPFIYSYDDYDTPATILSQYIQVLKNEKPNIRFIIFADSNSAAIASKTINKFYHNFFSYVFLINPQNIDPINTNNIEEQLFNFYFTNLNQQKVMGSLKYAPYMYINSTNILCLYENQVANFNLDLLKKFIKISPIVIRKIIENYKLNNDLATVFFDSDKSPIVFRNENMFLKNNILFNTQNKWQYEFDSQNMQKVKKQLEEEIAQEEMSLNPDEQKKFTAKIDADLIQETQPFIDKFTQICKYQKTELPKIYIKKYLDYVKENYKETFPNNQTIIKHIDIIRNLVNELAKDGKIYTTQDDFDKKIRYEVIGISNGLNLLFSIFDKKFTEEFNAEFKPTKKTQFQELENAWFKNGILAPYPKTYSIFHYVIEKNALNQQKASPEYIKAQLSKIAQDMVKVYKIHLMPEDKDIENTLFKLLINLNKSPELQNLIYSFKIKTLSKAILKQFNSAKIVFYITPGKENAQKALNLFYSIFKDDIGEKEWAPRYNQAVNTNHFLYFSQGDGDFKEDKFLKDYGIKPEDIYETDKIYFKKNVTGKDEDYHLIIPTN